MDYLLKQDLLELLSAIIQPIHITTIHNPNHRVCLVITVGLNSYFLEIILPVVANGLLAPNIPNVEVKTMRNSVPTRKCDL